MKRVLFIAILNIFFCNLSFAESYYFKECIISNAVEGNYVIDINKNVIEVELRAADGAVQNFKDKIKLIEKNKITSEKIKSAQGENLYYQYFLNSDSKSVLKLQFKREKGSDIDLYNLYDKRQSLCKNVKADWDKKKIDEVKISKEKKEILKAQEKIKKEQSSLSECQGNKYEKWTNCRGSYISNSGHKYIGYFINGKILKGISLYPGGAKYVGEFKNFLPNGYGTFEWSNGDKYFGAWKDGKSHGNGTKIWNDGRKYLGDFQNDKLHGEGTLFYPDGKKYVGEFANGKRHGQGTFSYEDGTAYVGKFLEGQEEGMGQCINKDGSSVPCISKTDVLTKKYSGKDTLNISIVAKKWVRLSQYETNTKKGKKIMDQLKSDFESKASELCSTKSSYNVLEKRVTVLEIDETPAYGLEAKVKLGINGVIECV